MTSTSALLNRRTLLGTTAAVVASNLVEANVGAAAEDAAIRPFRINVPEEVLIDLRHAWRRAAGLTAKPSPMIRKACRSRQCRS